MGSVPETHSANYSTSEGIIGARWLLGGKRRVGKVTSSVVFFDQQVGT